MSTNDPFVDIECWGGCGTIVAVAGGGQDQPAWCDDCEDMPLNVTDPPQEPQEKCLTRAEWLDTAR